MPQAPDAGADHLAHTVGQGSVLEGRDGHPPTGRILVDRPRFREVTQHLAHKERIAVGLAIHGMGEAHRGVIEGVTGGSLHQRYHAGVIEPRQLDARNTVLSTQRSQGLEEWVGVRQLTLSIGPEHEHPHRLFRPDHVTQQLQACLVRPLQVIQYEDDRLVLRNHDRQSDHRREQQVTLGVSIGRLRRPEPRQPARKRRDQPDQFGPMGVDMGDELVFGGVGDVMAERLGEELIRRGEILLAMPEQHARPGVERGAGRLGHQRGLAQTGLTRNEQRLASFATGDTLEGIRHRRHLGFAAHHTHRGAHAQTARQRHAVRGGPAERLPAHLDRLDRIGEALQDQWPDRVALVSAAPTGHQPHHIRSQDLAARAGRAELSCLDHRVPEVIAVLRADVAHTQPDAQAHGVLATTVVAFDSLLHGNSTRHGRGRRAEHHHEPVTQALHLGAARLGDRLTQDREVSAA